MPKLGKKQSVLKQGISRKRKGFKGVQKQAKRAASATSGKRNERTKGKYHVRR